MRPAIANEVPRGKLFCIVRVGHVHDVQRATEAAAARVLAQVVRVAVRGECAHVTIAARQRDAGRKYRVAAVGNVINREILPTVLPGYEDALLGIRRDRLVRVQCCGCIGQVCGHLRMCGVGGIDHLDPLASVGTVRPIVGAHVVVSGSILGIGSLIRVLGLLTHEFEIAVVAEFGIAAEAFLLRRLALQSTFRTIPGTADCLGN